MDSGSWSLLLSVLGLMLGFVSAYGQIKGFFIRLLRFSGESIAQWSNNRDAKVETLATSSTALVAYLARSFLFIAAVALATYVISDVLRATDFTPLWLILAIKLGGGFAIGTEFGSLHPTILSVSRRAMQLAKDRGPDG